jgi:hypothetical protein
MGGNGQLIRINKKTNKVDSIEVPGASKESFMPVMGKDENGNPTVLGTFNKNSGEYKASEGSTTPAAVVGGDMNLTGQDRYKTLSPAEQRQVDAWHDGTGIQPSQYSMRNNPKMQKLMDATQAVYPDMDFQKYGERQQFVRGYANKSPSAVRRPARVHRAHCGPRGPAGRPLRQARQQLGRHRRLRRDAYQRRQEPNWRQRTAGTAQPLKSGAETLSGEYQTMITRGKGGGQAERADYAGNVNKPLAAPEVQAAGLQTMLDGLKARHKEIVDAATSAAGQSWLESHPDVDKKITDTITKVQAKIDQLLPKKGDAPAAAPAATPPSPQLPAAAAQIPSGWKVYN